MWECSLNQPCRGHSVIMADWQAQRLPQWSMQSCLLSCLLRRQNGRLSHAWSHLGSLSVCGSPNCQCMGLHKLWELYSPMRKHQFQCYWSQRTGATISWPCMRLNEFALWVVMGISQYRFEITVEEDQMQLLLRMLLIAPTHSSST